MTPEQMAILGERFTVKVRVNDNGCWIWTAARHREGYGAFRVDGATVRTHIYAYRALVGPIPDGLDLDHLCHTNDPTCAGGRTCPHRPCCNPAHLEPVTPRENALRSPVLGVGIAAAQQSVRDRTHCPQEHPYDEINTHFDKNGYRHCRACNRDRANRNYQRKKEAA